MLTIPHDAGNHNGGQLQFGPDGALYIGVGDNADSSNGQNTAVLLGKILRIADPRVAGAAPEIYAYGLRNPWRFSFDSLTGDLLIADVGNRGWEEIDLLPAGAPAGANFGWACWEGTHPHGNCQAAGTVFPIYEYAHSATQCSITGGFIARDPTVPTLAGRYLFSDYCGTGVSALAVPVGAPPDIATFGTMRHIAGFGSDSDGHLYVTSLDGGVWRVTGTGAADKAPVAAFTMSSTTPAVGANLHLDASSSTDPDGPIFSYSWDVDGDGKVDGKGITFDVSYPTAGARPITLTVMDALGAKSSRTQAVYVGGKTTPPGTSDAAVRLMASLTVPKGQTLKSVRKRGLQVRFRSNVPATWTVTATLRKAAKAPAARLQDGRRAARQEAVQGTHRQRGGAPARFRPARLADTRLVVIRVQARVQAGGKSLQRSRARARRPLGRSDPIPGPAGPRV